MIDYLYLKLQNPWWENKAAINEDEKIKEFESLKHRYFPKQILLLPPNPKDIHLITGPRQVGKSTALKLYIRQCLKRKLNPRQLIYFNCDALSSEKDIIDLVLEINTANENAFSIVFLDEISSVANWPQGVKWLADAGQLKNMALFLTGSSSVNLKKSGELLPGRRGKGKDVIFFPISFYEYCRLKEKNTEKISLNDPKLMLKMREPSPRIKKHYREFIFTGGFLRHLNYGLCEESNDLYLKTLKSELFKNGKKEDSLREVVRKILNSLSSQTSYTNIAEEAELGSKNTAIDYLNFLVDSFFLKEVKFYDLSAQKIVLKKNKKFYTTDPYLVWLFEGFVTGSLNFAPFLTLIDESRLAENFIASELAKKQEEFFFFQNHRELDFYLPQKNLGIEVKFKEKITSQDIKFPNTLSQKILISKNILEKRGEVLIIPLYLFPLLDY